MKKRKKRKRLGLEKFEERVALTNLFPVGFDVDLHSGSAEVQAYGDSAPGGGEDDTLPGSGEDDTVPGTGDDSPPGGGG